MLRKPIIIAYCVLYTLIYFIFAAGCINPEGTGTGLFFMPLFTWVFLMMAFYYAAKQFNQQNFIFFLACLFSHYVLTAILFWLFMGELFQGESRLARTWRLDRTWVLLTIFWYLSGQIILWSIFIFSKQPRGDEN